jgi:WD40 repeat protein
LPTAESQDWYGLAGFSPDGQTLALAAGSNVDLFSLTTGKRSTRLADHQAAISTLDFAPDGQTLVTGSMDMTIKLWDVGSGQVQTTARPGARPWSVKFLPDGKTVVSTDLYRVHFWDAGNGLSRSEWQPPKKEYLANVSVAANGKLLAATLDSGSSALHLWDIEARKERAPLTPFPKDRLGALLLSPDATLLAIRNYGAGAGKLLDLTTGKERAVLPPNHAWAFAPDSRSLLVASGETGQLQVWDTSSGQIKMPLEGHTGRVDTVALSPDGRLAATAGSDGKVIGSPVRGSAWRVAGSCPGRSCKWRSRRTAGTWRRSTAMGASTSCAWQARRFRADAVMAS